MKITELVEMILTQRGQRRMYVMWSIYIEYHSFNLIRSCSETRYCFTANTTLMVRYWYDWLVNGIYIMNYNAECFEDWGSFNEIVQVCGSRRKILCESEWSRSEAILEVIKFCVHCSRGNLSCRSSATVEIGSCERTQSMDESIGLLNWIYSFSARINFQKSQIAE